MRTYLRILWWALYIAGALIVQQNIPGVDALVPGFLLSLQERRHWQTFWLFILFVLIQEGAGSLSFGSSLLWYSGQIVLYRLSQRLFVADNILFVLMIAVSLGAYHGALVWFMSAVQKVPVEYAVILQESILQAVIIPVIWGLAYFTRPKTPARSV